MTNETASSIECGAVVSVSSRLTTGSVKVESFKAIGKHFLINCDRNGEICCQKVVVEYFEFVSGI
jgi:hypothetical protein